MDVFKRIMMYKYAKKQHPNAHTTAHKRTRGTQKEPTGPEGKERKPYAGRMWRFNVSKFIVSVECVDRPLIRMWKKTKDEIQYAL